MIKRLNHELLLISDCTAQAIYTTATVTVDVGFSSLVAITVVEPGRQGLTGGWPLRAPALFRGEQGILMISLLVPCRDMSLIMILLGECTLCLIFAGRPTKRERLNDFCFYVIKARKQVSWLIWLFFLMHTFFQCFHDVKKWIRTHLTFACIKKTI